MPFIGEGHIWIVVGLIIVLIIFGPGRLPELGGALGKGIREFRRAGSQPEESSTSVDSVEHDLTQSGPQA